MMRWIGIGILSVTIASCASIPGGAPDWVSGKSAKYPDNRYLLGRGQANTAEDARNRARADLAQIFETAVSVETSDVTAFSTAPEGEGKGKVESQVTRNITTRTEQIIRGIQIAEIWQDPSTRQHHALAVLSRFQAATSLTQDIDRLDAATRGHVEQARNTPDLLLQVAAASRALETQLERDAVQKTLRVVDSTGRGVPPEFNSGKLASDLDGLLKRVRMRPQAAASSYQGLEGMLSGAMSASGFVPAAGGDAPYVLAGSLELDDLGELQGWYWMRGTLEVRLTETASGKVRGNKRWEVKTSSQQKGTAERRALDQVDAILKKELRPTIVRFATGG